MDESRLGKLPAELRNTICELVLVSHATIHIKSCLKADPDRAVAWERDSDRPNVALLQTCKQIQQEATSILYLDNVFTFTSHRDDSALAFENFIKVIGPRNAACLRSCLVDCIRIDTLIPETYEDLEQKIADGGLKVMALTKQLPKCMITAIILFCVSTSPIHIWHHEINFSPQLTSFAFQWLEMTNNMTINVSKVRQEQRRLPLADPQFRKLDCLGNRMGTVCLALECALLKMALQKLNEKPKND